MLQKLHGVGCAPGPAQVANATLTKYVDMLLRVDEAWMAQTGQTMFVYCIATPKQNLNVQVGCALLPRRFFFFQS